MPAVPRHDTAPDAPRQVWDERGPRGRPIPNRTAPVPVMNSGRVDHRPSGNEQGCMKRGAPRNDQGAGQRPRRGNRLVEYAPLPPTTRLEGS